MVKAILWDNDGVLVDTARLYLRATREALATVGVDLTRELYIELFLYQGKGAWHLAEEKGVSPSKVESLREARNARYAQLLRQGNSAINGAQETLANLHGTFTMGIVTSSNREHFDVIHQATGFLKYFDFAITGGDYTHYKPHPEPYLLGVERTGVSKGECIVIEDSARGLAAARAAGLRCLVIPNPLTAESDFSDAYMVLNDAPRSRQTC
jgi:HAD superfamily hydrolase (TIGR01509 family)